jgi:hypothetical protein
MNAAGKSLGRAGKLGQQGGNLPARGPKRFFRRQEYNILLLLLILNTVATRLLLFVSRQMQLIRRAAHVSYFRIKEPNVLRTMVSCRPGMWGVDRDIDVATCSALQTRNYIGNPFHGSSQYSWAV